MAELAPDDPLNAFHEIFHRHVAVIKRFGRFPHRNKILQRANTVAEEDFLENSSFRFDLPLIRRRGRRLRVRRHGEEAHREAARPRVPDPAAGHRRGPARRVRVQVCWGRTTSSPRRRSSSKKQGYIRIGDSVPDFTAETSMGPINFHEFIGDSWCVLFSHPADFTPVCTTEFGATAKLAPEWSTRNAKVIGLSVDSAEDHERWIADINETQHTTGELPDHRGQGSPGVDALRHARPDHLPPRVQHSARP